MACTTNTSEVVLEASTLFFGKEARICVEPVTGLVGGESFIASNSTTSYQIWFDIDGASTAPTPANGETLIEVDLATGYTESDAAAVIKSAVEAASAFYGRICVDTNCIVLEAPVDGAALASVSDVDSGFTLTQDEVGFRRNLGNTAEGIEITFEQTLFEITANQTGTQKLDDILQGNTIALAAGLQEVSKERLLSLIGEGFGDTYTPSGGEVLVGAGTSKNFVSSLALAGRLTLHPVRLPESDRSEDFTIWKTTPSYESINYSGTDKKVLSVNFNGLVDFNRPSEISLYAVGDTEQYLA